MEVASHQLSVWEMVLHAGPMVKFVIFLLLVFSVASWAIVISKYALFRKAKDRSERFLEAFWKSKNFAEAYRVAQDVGISPQAVIFSSGYMELQKLNRSKGSGGDESFEKQLATLDNLKRALRKAESQEIARLGRSLAVLATTGSATPFIGLFGTVWGIMTSFQDIGSRGSVSLAVVAPGISEALVVTAAGLAVAIPAVIFYNYYSNELAELESEMQNFSTDFLNLVERDMLTRKAD